MSLPHRLSYRPRAWRGDPLVIPIRCWADRARTKPLQLSWFGPSWVAAYGIDASNPLTPFDDLDVSQLDQGQITLKLNPTTVQMLTQPLYFFKIRAIGGAISPVTVFLGQFSVDG